MPHNLNLVSQSGWRVAALHYVARALGVLVHVEGMPFGSARNFRAASSREGTGGTTTGLAL